MKRRDTRVRITVILLLALAGSGVVCAGDAEPQLSEAEAQRLVDEIAPQVEKLRGLSFKKPVSVSVVNDEAVQAYVLQRLRAFDQERHLADEADRSCSLEAERTDHDQIGQAQRQQEEIVEYGGPGQVPHESKGRSL